MLLSWQKSRAPPARRVECVLILKRSSYLLRSSRTNITVITIRQAALPLRSLSPHLLCLRTALPFSLAKNGQAGTSHENAKMQKSSTPASNHTISPNTALLKKLMKHNAMTGRGQSGGLKVYACPSFTNSPKSCSCMKPKLYFCNKTRK